MAKTKQIPIAEATDAELRAFLSQSLGVDKPATTGRDKLLANIAPMWPNDFIVLPVAEAAQAQAGPAPEKPEHLPAAARPHALRGSGSERDPRVTLRIPEQDVPGGKRAVEVNVNGVNILIPRNRDVTIAYRYFEALRNAVRDTYVQGEDGELMKSQVPAYPHSVIAAPSQEEVDAWLAETATLGVAAAKAA